MKLRSKLTSVLAVVMVSLITISLPVFAKIPKQPTGIPIPQYSTIPDIQYIPEPPQVNEKVVPQWNSSVHSNIIREGIAKVKINYPWLSSRLTTQIPGTNSTPEQLLMNGINWPDSYETDNGSYKGHFFDPVTALNYAQEPVPTAYTRFNNHYYSAVNAPNKTVAWNELSYSLHYFGDLNAPHHAANVPMALFGDFSHTPFESFADSNYAWYSTSWTPDTFVVNSDMLSIARYYSSNAASYITYAEAFTSNTSMRVAIDNTLPFAQSGAAGMILKFINQTNW